MPRRPPTRPPEPPPHDNGDETREEKFARIAPPRVNHILHHTRVLGNLANRNNYAYTEEQIARIFEVIESTTNDVKALFLRGRRQDFRL
jgi:hypothetical protein